MSLIVFRALVALTLIVMWIARLSGGRMNPYEFLPFYYWFVVSVFVFAAFGVVAAVKAFRDPPNRRAYLFDIVLAVIWVPYWFANLR
jgi:H+/Cl- antiporter ClcA